MEHNGVGSILGFISVGVAKIFGLITFASAFDALVLGLIGAIGGWIGTKIITTIFKLIVKTKPKKKKDEDK